MTKPDEEVRREFDDLVNMTPKQLDDWLSREESKQSGWKKEGDGETIGHESGRKIVSILQKNKSARTEADLDHMRKVVGYIKRHKAQPPSGDWTDTTWRYSLMNWGHDPCKDV